MVKFNVPLEVKIPSDIMSALPTPNPNINPHGYMTVPSIRKKFSKRTILSGKSWVETQVILGENGLRMPTLSEARELIKYLFGNYRTGGSDATPEEMQKILYEDILSGPTNDRSITFRKGLFLDSRFAYEDRGYFRSDRIVMLSGHKRKIDKLEPTSKIRLDRFFKDDRSINFSDWLKDKATKEGLPSPLCGCGYDNPCNYWFPKDGGIGVFGTINSRTKLDEKLFLFNDSSGEGKTRFYLDLGQLPEYSHIGVGTFAVKD